MIPINRKRDSSSPTIQEKKMRQPSDDSGMAELTNSLSKLNMRNDGDIATVFQQVDGFLHQCESRINGRLRNLRAESDRGKFQDLLKKVEERISFVQETHKKFLTLSPSASDEDFEKDKSLFLSRMREPYEFAAKILTEEFESKVHPFGQK